MLKKKWMSDEKKRKTKNRAEKTLQNREDREKKGKKYINTVN